MLNQQGRPVAFFSKRLNEVEKKWAAVELEAYAIVYALRKFRQYVLGRPFELLTDQKGVSHLFGKTSKLSTKNAKLCRWRLEIAEFDFLIKYRPGVENVAADDLSRVYSIDSTESATGLAKSIHKNLAHPGVTRGAHYLQQHFEMNISSATSIMEKVIKDCDICARLKPRFLKLASSSITTATRPWQRLSIDFAGPKPASNNNKFMLTIVDEFSRYPFAFAVSQVNSLTVIKCLTSLFTLYGPPDCIHSDRGKCFESLELAQFLESWNVDKTRTTPYHPSGNGQCERFNATIWNTILLRLEESKGDVDKWESELNLALMNIRSLPSRALKYQSPHSLFLGFERRSTLQATNQPESKATAAVVPEWITADCPVYFKCHARSSKYDEKVQKVIILDILSPYVVCVKFENGREDTVLT